MKRTMHEQFMRQALALAGRGAGRTAPNPPVGAVLVRDGVEVGRGFHPAAGEPHAEIFALRQAGESARGADLYVTLEPCCHQGRTGPCTEALIRAGVHRVFVGVHDPNPQVAGQGIRRLQAVGIEVVVGLLEKPCHRLIAPFAKHILSGLPFVTFKAAMTLDGRTATAGGESQWISCEQSRLQVHRLRNRVDAVMVGAQTVLDDDPRLTTRLAEGGRDAVRVVVDSRLRTPPQAAVYAQESAAPTLLLTAADQPAARLRPYRQHGVEVIGLGRAGEHLDLVAAMHCLGERNLQSILLEGGATLAGAMLRSGLIDRVMLYVAPLLFGGSDGRALFAGAGVQRLAEAFRLSDLQLSMVGEDLLLEGEVARCSPD
ncbi:MAG: bifunctional diaminohydroxyphosphoribosylaminopyrimidine deaminase/5-amino-6-(5-phosphoribosylamino)uracil reductase RibD [Desulfuromonadales bacterium]|nr:bifunctional diaminohydroxyphosphoribosylaminopyrimidine deaminase/5-amino-6-(5-phosphoribosylamino)uracil reductase RibD [Desulfuromonadales bacterium]